MVGLPGGVKIVRAVRIKDLEALAFLRHPSGGSAQFSPVQVA